MIIVIEGTDAAGKATQSQVLERRLPGRNHRIAFPTYDADETALCGPIIGKHLHGAWRADRPSIPAWPDATRDDMNRLDAFVFQSLMTLNRYEVAPKIAALDAGGTNVILDRYWPSGYVYGSTDGLDRDWLLRVHRLLPKPDLFVLLDVPYDVALERRPDRRDRYERMGKSFYDCIRDTYLDLWATPPRDFCRAPGRGNWRLINADDGIEAIHKQIMDAAAAVRPPR